MISGTLSQVSCAASASWSSGVLFQMPFSIAASVPSCVFHHLLSCSCRIEEVVVSGENCGGARLVSGQLQSSRRNKTYSEECENQQHRDNRTSDNLLLHARAFRPQSIQSTSQRFDLMEFGLIAVAHPLHNTALSKREAHLLFPIQALKPNNISFSHGRQISTSLSKVVCCMYMCTKDQSKGKKEKSIQRRETREQVQYYLGGLPKHLAQLPYPYPDGSYIITYNLPPTSNHTPSLNLTSLSLTLSPAEGKRPTIISGFQVRNRPREQPMMRAKNNAHKQGEMPAEARTLWLC